MPSSSSAASSTEHWISTPGAATVAPIRQATALDGASASTGTVVSTSRKPNAAAVAASAASSSGSSSRLVTCAWLDGVRRARSLVIAIVSSAGRSSASTRASLAGVAPAVSLTTSARGVKGSTNSRAKFNVGQRHRLGGDVQVEAVPGDEGIERVEVRLGHAVHLDDPPIGDDKARHRVGRRVHGDQAQGGVRRGEPVEVHALGVHEPFPAGLHNQFSRTGACFTP